MVWCVSYSSLETVDWSLYKFGSEGVNSSGVRYIKKYRYRDNLSISYRFLYYFSRFRYYRKVSIIIEKSKNVSINQQHLVCDCTITLEMKVGSVQSSHFKSLSTSFLGLILVLYNSFAV